MAGLRWGAFPMKVLAIFVMFGFAALIAVYALVGFIYLTLTW